MRRHAPGLQVHPRAPGREGRRRVRAYMRDVPIVRDAARPYIRDVPGTSLHQGADGCVAAPSARRLRRTGAIITHLIAAYCGLLRLIAACRGTMGRHNAGPAPGRSAGLLPGFRPACIVPLCICFGVGRRRPVTMPRVRRRYAHGTHRDAHIRAAAASEHPASHVQDDARRSNESVPR